MKSIVCFGDSNTWGYNAETGNRFPYEQRWTSLLQEGLGREYTVVPEGLNGRTTVFDDPFSCWRNGLKALPYCLISHKPVDLLVFMLGTNDTKDFYNPSVMAVGMGMRTLVEAARGQGYGPDEGDPEILIIAPAVVIPGDQTAAAFDLRQFRGGVEISLGLAEEYSAAAREMGCHFADASRAAGVSPVDGVHLRKEDHAALAGLVLSAVNSIFTGKKAGNRE